ncbi:MAG TPA: malto-oligosyltrehalose synthase, partial [Candidatus Dormibacteraeota bacterium]|nr:malto-oligosyltrehalose synthase [Candidatus Dormibacteraeota bacterium]
MTASRIPVATYRLQFHRSFTFADACNILDYLQQLGISDVYASPILTSRSGSTHGYDGTDPTRIDPDLGGEEGFATFQRELQKRGMGLLLDVVPNHMSASSENRWWMDVLENGPNSAFASYFDIDWHPGPRDMENRILLPVLGKPFGEVLDSGELALAFEDAKFFITYFDLVFPVAPRSYRNVLRHATKPLRIFLGEDSSALQEYEGILAALESFASANSNSSGDPSERRLQFSALHERLRTLVNDREIARIINESLAEINGNKNDPASFNELQSILAGQHYKLAYWQNVNDSINYRRFFAVTELVGMRVDDPLVFDALHAPLLRTVSRDVLTGLRIDHIDGLRDPAAYLARLQQRLAGADESNPVNSKSSAYVLVEKILARGESLPSDWLASGTTGYDYLNYSNDVFVRPQSAKDLENIYASFTGRDANFSDVLYQKKKLVMNTLLGVEMRSLGRQLGELAAQDRYARELPRTTLLEALIETTACVPAYRTYIRSLEIPAEARTFIEQAVAQARERKPHLDPASFDFLRDVLLLENPSYVIAGQREARLAFVMRWQQFTGPIVAKGVEDTALYVYHPLLSLNEVGGDPVPSAVSSENDFWAFLQSRRGNWPHSMNATTTHDTKRSEDVRARINVLSEIPEEWNQRLQLWSAWNANHKILVEGKMIPDRNEEYFLYQSLLGTWPPANLSGDMMENLFGVPVAFEKRIQEYIVKAVREAMVYTRWTRPNEMHETAIHNFVSAILSPARSAEFLADFHDFERSISYFGMLNSCAQTLLKMTTPGVPDFFQGSELWDLRLVDPDNRQPVDFPARAASLQNLTRAAPESLNSSSHHQSEFWNDGHIKLWLIRKTLQYRQAHAALFSEGDLLPAEVRGPAAENILAFFRHHKNAWALTLVPRWLAKTLQRPGTPIPSNI